MHIVVNGRQLTVERTVGGDRELREEFLATCNMKPRWSTLAFVHTVRGIEHPDVASAGIFADEFPDNDPHE